MAGFTEMNIEWSWGQPLGSTKYVEMYYTPDNGGPAKQEPAPKVVIMTDDFGFSGSKMVAEENETENR